VFEALYKSVRDGSETRRSLEFNNRKNYREEYAKELAEIDQQEIWRAGKTVRALRVSLVPLCTRYRIDGIEFMMSEKLRMRADQSSPTPRRTRSKRLLSSPLSVSYNAPPYPHTKRQKIQRLSHALIREFGYASFLMPHLYIGLPVFPHQNALRYQLALLRDRDFATRCRDNRPLRLNLVLP
jgi:hypothetical protein